MPLGRPRRVKGTEEEQKKEEEEKEKEEEKDKRGGHSSAPQPPHIHTSSYRWVTWG